MTRGARPLRKAKWPLPRAGDGDARHYRQEEYQDEGEEGNQSN